jgi:drug/metabolite transporter (DMT)-like permease
LPSETFYPGKAMNIVVKNQIKLHFIVLILGFTAILGKLITLNATDMIWYRMLMAFLALGVYVRLKKKQVKYPPKIILQMTGVGIIIALHWITFFYSIKVSNVSVALGTFASTTFFTALLEPLIFRTRADKYELLLGIVIIIGLYLIFRFEFKYRLGIISSLVSAFLAGLFTVLNKKLTHKHDPVSISFYEMGSGFLAITVYFLITGHFANDFPLPSAPDWMWLLLLSIVCTAYAFVVSVEVMKVLSAYTTVLAFNMEPVYAILLASWIFGSTEFMSFGFYAGTVLIMAAVFLYPVIYQKK